MYVNIVQKQPQIRKKRKITYNLYTIYSHLHKSALESKENLIIVYVNKRDCNLTISDSLMSKYCQETLRHLAPVFSVSH